MSGGEYTAADPAEDVVAVVADNLYSLGENSGFAGQKVDGPNRSITVHWKGSAPADIRNYVASRPLGVSITLIEGARFSRTESLAAAHRLAGDAIAGPLALRSVSVNGDGSGLTARVKTKAPPAAALRRSARAVSRSAVEFRAGADTFLPAAARPNDAPAWKGGARTRQAGGVCSTGFAVLVGTSGRLLSANHCDPSANAVVSDGAGERIAPGGSSVAGLRSIDSQLIDPSASPATVPRIYVGAWNSGTTAVVKNWSSNWEGQRVCTSGATSGQHCGTIVDDATTVPWASGSFYIEVQADGRGVMGAGGDSGGPVFASTSGGVQARGIILGISDFVPCGSVNPDVAVASDLCANNVLYAPISVVLKTWGVKLEVG